MATQLESARAGIITDEMKKAVEKEPISAEQLRDLIAAGLSVLPSNVKHSISDPRAIGKNLKTKVNANRGAAANAVPWTSRRKSWRLPCVAPIQ